mmetsp:Transcript_34586/g.99297  ORF Transcript_34586/g.99297 Transcript_34586/m.99297 type:complete len:235 (+) Transcript_34586:146-850(+)
MAASSLSVSATKARRPSAVFSVAQPSAFMRKRNCASLILPPHTSPSPHSAAAVAGSSRLGSSPEPSAKPFSRAGGMVMRSTPARASISSSSWPLPREGRQLAGMQMVSWPCFLKYSYIRRTATTPGSSAGSQASLPCSRLCQSSTRPGKGEMRRAPYCADATACAKPKTRVMLHVIPSFSSSAIAAMPSQVPASLMSTRLRGTPASSYRAMMRLARRRVSSLSKLSRGSTSVET